MKKTTNWIAPNGAEVEVTAELVTTREINADGHKVAVTTPAEIRVAIAVAGQVVGAGRPNRRVAGLPVGRISAIGRAALNAEQTAKVEAMIAKLEATPEWQAKLAMEEQRRQEAAEYEDSRRAIRRAMSY